MSSDKKTSHYTELMQNFNPNLGLSREEFFGFALLNQVLTKKISLDLDENKILSDFVAAVINNPSWRKRLLKLNHKTDSLAASFLLEINFKTRRLNEFNNVYNKIETHFEIIKHGEPLPASSKLTWPEIAAFRDVASLAVTLRPWQGTEFGKQNKALSTLTERSLAANATYKSLVGEKNARSIFKTMKEAKLFRNVLKTFMNLKEKLVSDSPKLTPGNTP